VLQLKLFHSEKKSAKIREKILNASQQRQGLEKGFHISLLWVILD
jgi:hypothetical protein